MIGRLARRIARLRKYGSQSRPRIIRGIEIGVPVPIPHLVYPWRYDIVVRIEFFRYLKRNRGVLEDVSGEAHSAQPVLNYRTWFKEVAVARFRPGLYGEEDRFDQAFRKRIFDSVGIWDSIASRGFDSSRPIRLHSGIHVRMPDGTVPRWRYFAGDGCHRLACLYLQGARVIQPSHYELALFDDLQPLDNTTILKNCLPLSSEDLEAFDNVFGLGLRDLRRLDNER